MVVTLSNGNSTRMSSRTSPTSLLGSAVIPAAKFDQGVLPTTSAFSGVMPAAKWHNGDRDGRH